MSTAAPDLSGLGEQIDDFCPRCTRFKIEIPIRRTDTEQRATVCRVCARELSEAFVEVVAPELGEVVPYGEMGYGSDKIASWEEIHKFCYLRKYADGYDWVDREVLVDEYGYSFAGAGTVLGRLASERSWLAPRAYRKGYRIKI